MRPLDDVKHIGLVTRDLDACVAALSRVLGLGPFRFVEPEAFAAPRYYEKTYRGSEEDFALRVAFAPFGPLEIELIQPVRGRTVHADFLRNGDGGLHHLAVEVPDLRKATDALAAEGGVVIQSGKRAGLLWAYVEVKALSGLVLELMQPTGDPPP